METRLLKEELKKTEMPLEMKERIIKKCMEQSVTEDNTMTRHNSRRFFKHPIAAAAALAICICLTGVSALAASGKLQGYFKDITNWNGAVVGTSYEQATDEIEILASSEKDNLIVDIRFLLPTEAPYAYLETFGIENYELRNQEDKVVAEGRIDMKEISGGAITLSISTKELEPGTYILSIGQLVGGSKADQPLILYGNWECEFIK